MENLAYFDPLLFKCPKGAITKGETVEFKIEVNLDCVCNEAYLMLREDKCEEYSYIPMQRKENFFYASVQFNNHGHFWYNFKLNYNDFSKYLSKTYNSFSEVLNQKGEDFLQLVSENKYECTNSLQGGIIYQIFVDRFCKKGNVQTREPLILREDWGGSIKKNTENPLIINQEVFGGNFEGVKSKLNFLKELGVTTIYFNPISMANSNHKYDTADYMHVDPMYGTDQDFEELVKEAKQKGIKIVLDGVYNHTGSDSVYFNKNKTFPTLGAYNSKDSIYYDWYSFDEYPDRYSSWWGIDTLPSIKDDCKAFQNFIAGDNGVIEKYMKMGVSGFRLDVVDEINDEFTKQISNKVKSFDKNAPVIGEVWEDASTKISYSNRRKYFTENELNSVMNYPVKESIISYLKTREPYDLNSTLRMLLNNYPKIVLDNLMNFLTTHDTRRIYSEIRAMTNDNLELAKIYLKIATIIMFTLPGVPSIFYGDEYGMENNDGSSRGCYDWENYNNEIFNWFKQLTKIRQLPVFKDGELNILLAKNGKFIFERYSKNEHIVVLTNLKESEIDINLEGSFISLKTGQKIKSFVLKQNEIEILYEKR